MSKPLIKRTMSDPPTPAQRTARERNWRIHNIMGMIQVLRGMNQHINSEKAIYELKLLLAEIKEKKHD